MTNNYIISYIIGYIISYIIFDRQDCHYILYISIKKFVVFS